MNVIRKMIAEIRDSGGDEPEALNYVIENLTLEQYREYSRPYVADEVRRVYREQALKVERDYRNATKLPGYDSTRELRELLATTFALRDGTRVPWGQATAAQHLERAAYQRSRAAAMNEDADAHEEAAIRIIRAGVTCLDDLRDEAAA